MPNPFSAPPTLSGLACLVVLGLGACQKKSEPGAPKAEAPKTEAPSAEARRPPPDTIPSSLGLTVPRVPRLRSAADSNLNEAMLQSVLAFYWCCEEGLCGV